jgi:hypothetical protein
MDAEEEQIKEVYAQFGLAAYHGQCFETTLSNILLLDARVKGEVTTLAEIDELELKQQKQTMGVLIRDLRAKVDLPANTQPVIDLALERRNFLNHRFFREHAENFVSEAGRCGMLAELTSIQVAISQANRMGTMLAMALLRFLGITPDKLEQEFEQLMQRARERT